METTKMMDDEMDNTPTVLDHQEQDDRQPVEGGKNHEERRAAADPTERRQEPSPSGAVIADATTTTATPSGAGATTVPKAPRVEAADLALAQRLRVADDYAGHLREYTLLLE